MNTMFDFAPLWRSGIGFDHLFNMLEQAGKTDQAENYPPYDIERPGEDVYRLTLALAGWMPDEITVITEPNVLVVSGQKAEPENKQYLYRGIPPVGFEPALQPRRLRRGQRGAAAKRVIDSRTCAQGARGEEAASDLHCEGRRRAEDD